MHAEFRELAIRTTWGEVSVRLDPGGVVGCRLPRLDGRPTRPFRILQCGADPVSTYVAAVLRGEPAEAPPLGALGGTRFQRTVWEQIAGIPFGETRAYGALAAAIGQARACRAAAGACGRNPVPLFIPCHRVVGAAGRPGGFSAGLPWKALLLAAERQRFGQTHPCLCPRP